MVRFGYALTQGRDVACRISGVSSSSTLWLPVALASSVTTNITKGASKPSRASTVTRTPRCVVPLREAWYAPVRSGEQVYF